MKSLPAHVALCNAPHTVAEHSDVAACSCASAAAIFGRYKLTKPAALLPTLTSATTCVSFCPIVFQSAHAPSDAHVIGPERPDAGGACAAASGAAHAVATGAQQTGAQGDRLLELGYKLVFAVGSTDSVFVYDTGEIPQLSLPDCCSMYLLCTYSTACPNTHLRQQG